ncbi:hypothetical protein [Amycolatopsis sp. NPDC051102]|uniref:hypothetical protein n=1 Tax=Amycolatopsis sp. NPDC051102 TaxID=3155163 RepID=UPI0034392033
MFTWIIACWAVLSMLLSASAGFAALFVRDPARRADAYKVLKLLVGVRSGDGRSRD